MAKHDKQTNLQFVTELLIHVQVQQKLHFVHLNTCKYSKYTYNNALKSEKTSIGGHSQMTSPPGEGVAQRWHYYISLYSKKGDKGEGGVKNPKIKVISFMDGP